MLMIEGIQRKRQKMKFQTHGCKLQKVNHHFIFLHSKCICCCFIIIFYCTIHKQALGIDSKRNVFLANVNLHQGWRTMGEVSAGFGKFSYTAHLSATSGHIFQMGSQFNFNSKHLILGPQLSYNYVTGMTSLPNFTTGGSLIYYTDFDKKEIYLNPHIGIGLYYQIELVAGYNIPITGNSMKDLVNNFTLSITIPIVKRTRIEGFL